MLRIILVTLLCTLSLHCVHAENPIQIENRLPGSTDWQLTRVRVDGGQFRSPWIEGYCNRQSVTAGKPSISMFRRNPHEISSSKYFEWDTTVVVELV